MKKNGFTNGLTLKVMTVSMVLTAGLSPEVMAQFDKYKSRTRFNRTTKPADTNAVAVPDTGKSASSLLEKAGSDTGFSGSTLEEDDEGDSGDVADISGGEEEGGEESGGSSGSRDSFGRTSSRETRPSKVDKKFVNLNPETAFGPEVVTAFDFPNVSILDLTKHMQKLTGLNLILDKDIKGKISISSPTPITIGDAWKAYLQALSINGYSLVKSGAFYTIVNNRDIRYSPTTMYTGTYTPNTENYVMQIIPLKYVNSREVANSFRPFMSRYGRIIEIKQTNTVIVQETGTHINRLMKLIKFIDIPGHEESLQIIKVKNSSAQEIATLLDKILKGNSADSKLRATTTGATSTSQVNISRIIAEPRTNSIIAMANSDGARELRSLVDKLDVKVVAAGSGQIHVYYLNYGDAETLSKTLSALTGNAPRTGAAGGLTRFSSPTSTTATTATLFNNDVKITADKDNNALVVTASPTDYETVRSVIAKLDVPRDQVYVEGLMMETQVSKGNAFGISLLGAYGSGGTQKVGYGNTSDLLSLMTNNITNLSGLFVGGGVGRKIDIPGPDGKPLSVNSVNGLITAIATHATTNVLATPQILTLDNVEGIFENGEKVPILKTTNASNGTSQTAVEQQTVALTLKITPQINKVTRFIKLKIDQKIEDFSSRALPAGVQNNGVGTVIRSLNTTVVVRDKDTIAMGGLMRDKETNSVSKVPLLGDIPVLGWLFKNTTKSVEKVNLLFFMTPKILASYEKTNSENVKDLLNRRQSHLKNMTSDDDAFSTTVKGLYEKAKKQSEGPLYDTSESSQYRENNNSNSVPDVTMNDDLLNAPPAEAPNYQDILQKAGTKEVSADIVKAEAAQALESTKQ